MLRAKIDAQYQRTSITSPNVFAIPAYLAAYNNPEVVMWKTAMLNYVVKNYRYVREKLGLIPGLKVMELEASYLMWINYAETNLTSQQVNELLLKYKLIVSKDNDFVEAPATCFRINIGTSFAMVVKLVNILITIFSK